MSFAQNKVYFSGTLENCPYTEFEIESVDKTNDINKWQKVPIKNGSFSVVMPTNDFTVLECYFDGKRIEFYASAGDSLVLKADFKKLIATAEFSGKGNKTAQFYTSWKTKFASLHKKDLSSRKNSTPAAYLDARKKLRDSEIAFLQEYATKHGLNESSFVNYYISEFTFSWYASIGNYIRLHNKDIQKEGVKPEYTSLIAFLDEINYEELAYLETKSAQSYYTSYINLIKYRKLIYDKTFPPPNFDPTFWFIRVYNLSKQLLPKKGHETYAMSMFYELLNPVSKERLLPIYEEFIQTCSAENRAKLNKAFNKDTVKEKQEIPSNTVVKNTDASLEEILSNYKGSVVYVDFWASWCAPCIDEIPASKKMQNTLEDTNVKFLFISIDRDEKSWKKAIAAYQIPGIHYRVNSLKTSVAIQSLTAGGIPHYIIVGKDGKILDKNAKSPSDSQLVSELKKLLNP
jgi:thiol-disulfide isomerase/thioredoxin